jgi:hypothetical protein
VPFASLVFSRSLFQKKPDESGPPSLVLFNGTIPCLSLAIIKGREVHLKAMPRKEALLNKAHDE